MEILQEAWLILFPVLLLLCGIVGLLAMCSPRMFEIVAEASGVIVTKPKNLPINSTIVDIDQFMVRHSREFGSIVTLVTIYLGLFFGGYLDASWTPFFLLFLIGVLLCMSLSGLMALRGQVSQIAHHLAEARIDVLTGLPNRRALDEELERRLLEKSRVGTDFCVSILDIDHFKEINDKHGHLAGDKILAECIAAVIKRSKGVLELAARYGGDEFVIVHPNCNLAQASASISRLRPKFSSHPLSFEGANLTVQVSIGVTEATGVDSHDSLFARADQALYAAKQAGRNRSFQNNGTACQEVKDLEGESRVVSNAPESNSRPSNSGGA